MARPYIWSSWVQDDKRIQAQQLASSALDDLAIPGLSIEIPIRKAMRAAALSGHPFMRGWLLLQLVDFRDAGGDVEAMKLMLQGYFPDELNYQTVAINVFNDYKESRSSSAFPDKMYGASVTDLEHLIATGRAALREGLPDPQIMEIFQRTNQMLSRIKNRLQGYLMQIEGGDFSTKHEGKGEGNA